QIGKMAIAMGELPQQIGVELKARGGVEQVDAVFFVDGLAPHDAPLILARNSALLEEIIEAAGAQHISELAVDFGALADGHLGLRNGALALEVDAGAAQEMQDGNP